MYYKGFHSGMARWERCIWEGGVSRSSLGMPPSQHRDVFTHLEALLFLFTSVTEGPSWTFCLILLKCKMGMTVFTPKSCCEE